MKNLFLIPVLLLMSLISNAQETTRTRAEEAQICMDKGNAMAENGDWKNALQQYNNAVGYDPKNGDAYYHRALASQNLRDFRAAVMDYSKAIYLDNNNANAYYGRGMCFHEMGRKNDSCIDFSKASGLGNNDAATAMMNFCN